MEDFDKVSIEDDEFRFALQQLMRGNGNYFSLVFQKTRQSLYIFALLLVKEEEAAADLLKETYLRIVESAESLRRTEHFPLWARRIMHNLVLFKYGIERANGTEGADYDALMKKLVAERNDRTPSGEADEEELSRLLIETIFQLSTEERIALICFFHDRMMLNDIAVMMDCSRDQIKALIFSARGRIREQMGRYELERHVDIKSISPYLARGMQIYNEEHLLPVSTKEEIYREVEDLLRRREVHRHDVDSQRSMRGRSQTIRFATRRTVFIVTIAVVAACIAFLVGYSM